MAESKVENEASEVIEKTNANDSETKEENVSKPCEDHWQSCRQTIRERNQFMFKNTLMSDVSFLVGTQDKEEEDGSQTKSQQTIPAHKYVLAISSPVFYAMFYGDLAEVKDTIVIPDATQECFVEFLRYLYYDEVKFSLECVMGVNYLAKKYIVPALEKKCVAFVEEAVNASNVFKLLSLARTYKDDFVERVCWEFLDNETTECLKSEMFSQVDREVVCQLLKRDSLHAKEIDLFLALQKWTEAQNTGQENEEGLEESVKDIVNLVRCPLMSQREFAEHVAKSKLLRHEDVINMFLKFNDTLEDDTVLPFSQVPRRGYYRCSLYKEVYGTWDSSAWDPAISQMPNVLTFSSNSNILLCGVGLYGNDNNDDSYSFHVYVADEDEQVLLSSEGSFTCHTQCFAYDVIFNKPVKVYKNVWYTIHATVRGPRGVYGGKTVVLNLTSDVDVEEIDCGAVNFLFKDLGSGPENMYNHFSGLLYFLH